MTLISSSAAADILHTPLCDLLNVRYPIILAGMGGVARVELVAAVAEAGGAGFLGMVREPVALIKEQIDAVRARTARPFGVNLIPAATDAKLLEGQVNLCIAEQVPMVELFWEVSDAARGCIARLRQAGVTVVYQVGSVKDAQQAQQAGANVLVAQGVEAGGHVRGTLPLELLLKEVLSMADIPVAAAGGLVTGDDVAHVITQGAQAAVMGTALMATCESYAHDYHKQRLLEGHSSETVITEDFHINWPPHAPVRVLANSVTRGERGDPYGAERITIAREGSTPIPLFSTDSPLRSMQGDLEAMVLYAGMGVDHITDIVSVEQRVHRIIETAVELLKGDAAKNPDLV